MFRLLRSERGANLVEWGILVSLIAVVALAAVSVIGTDTSSMFIEIDGGF